jgi:colanic acid biosynthesis glycosyl transferase WcaI
MRVQLWSYNYDPEPAGTGPVSAACAKALRDRGHEVEVVAAHPHYPTPAWGRSLRPYRERRDGVPIYRLPIWIGRSTSVARVRQEIVFAATQAIASPLLPTADVIVAVSPSFPALLPAMLHSAFRRTPLVLWIQDILPDGAVSTGIITESSRAVRLARAFEATAYRRADRIAVISDTFRDNLLSKGVPAVKVRRIYNPATRRAAEPVATHETGPLLAMGNIGHSQGLAELVREFESAPETHEANLSFVITGSGVATDATRAEIRSDRVSMPGLVSSDELESELRRATLGVVSQRADVAEFNVPSKLMNLMAYGLPVLARARAGSEVEQLVQRSGGGWVVDASRAGEFARTAAAALRDPAERARRGAAGRHFADEHFSPEGNAAHLEELLLEVVPQAPGAPREHAP